MPNSMNVGQEFVFKFTKFQNVSRRVDAQFCSPGALFHIEITVL